MGAALGSLRTNLDALTSTEYHIMSECLDVRSPLKVATVEMSSEEKKNVSGSKIIPLVRMLRHNIVVKSREVTCYGWAALQPYSAPYGGRAEWLRDSQPALKDNQVLEMRRVQRATANAAAELQHYLTEPNIPLKTQYSFGYNTNMCTPIYMR